LELIRGLHNLRERHKGCVLTIGKFDGVHLGHKAVLSQVVNKAHELNLPSTVMVFEPQPEELFQPQHAPARLSTLRDKCVRLAKLGIDRLICVKFDRQFAQYSAEQFISELLVDKFGVKFLVVGDDFRFGQKRAGDFALLEEEGKRSNFEVVSTASYRLDDCRISSSVIRKLLADGLFSQAKAMLGRGFSIDGKVVHGEQNGRTIGFPTANLIMKRVKSPVEGVFTANVIHNNTHYKGVANIGTRPTLNGKRVQLEVHLFDVDKDLYGQYISVELMHKIRHEIKFDSFDMLRKQIELDARQARELLGA
jgi:riboflavin kinase/FMN adenylyltransferase